MKILFLTNRSPYPVKDGQSRRTYNILKGLADRHEVHLLSLLESVDEALPENVKHLQNVCETVELVPGPSKALSTGMVARLMRSLVSRDPYTVWRHYSKVFLDRVSIRLKAEAFDIVHCDILPLVYCVRPVQGVFCALTDHDVSYMKAWRLAGQAKNPFLKIFLYLEAVKLKHLESRIFSQLDLGVTVSDLDRNHLERICPEGRFSVVENGVDVDAFVPNPSVVEANSMVWVGGFHHQPNVEAIRYFLKDVYPKIKKKNTGATLTIVGGGVPDWLKRIASQDSAVEVTGYVDDPNPYIQRAAVFVAPILSGGGTKLKVLEAMAVGKAIVSTSIGVEGIEGEDEKHFMVADVPELFASKAVSLLNDSRLRERIGAKARQRAIEKYDWSAICEGMSALYRSARKTVHRST